MFIKKISYAIVVMLVVSGCVSSSSPTTANGETRKKSFLLFQAIKVTDKNIKHKDHRLKKGRKRAKHLQEDLNEQNTKSKVKPQKKHGGDFNIY